MRRWRLCPIPPVASVDRAQGLCRGHADGRRFLTTGFEPGLFVCSPCDLPRLRFRLVLVCAVVPLGGASSAARAGSPRLDLMLMSEEALTVERLEQCASLSRLGRCRAVRQGQRSSSRDWLRWTPSTTPTACMSGEGSDLRISEIWGIRGRVAAGLGRSPEGGAVHRRNWAFWTRQVPRSTSSGEAA
jgi:hypothetical protein